MKFDKNFYIDNIKTIFYALIIAVLIRSIIVQPFYIPSSSMEPTLLVGDRIFVSKYTYGYSKHSFPFSPPIIKNRIFYTKSRVMNNLRELKDVHMFTGISITEDYTLAEREMIKIYRTKAKELNEESKSSDTIVRVRGCPKTACF